MRLGHGPRRAVAILWAFTALLSGVALLPVYTDKGNAIVPFIAGAAWRSACTCGSTPVCGRRGKPPVARAHPTSVVGPEVLSDGATEVPPEVVDLASRRRKRA